jgi:hypothetical protein
MSKPTLEMRVLQRGAELLGSERALARYLRVPMPDLFLWLKGAERPTRATFLAAVDLLMERGDTTALEGMVDSPADETAQQEKKARKAE